MWLKFIFGINQMTVYIEWWSAASLSFAYRSVNKIGFQIKSAVPCSYILGFQITYFTILKIKNLRPFALCVRLGICCCYCCLLRFLSSELSGFLSINVGQIYWSNIDREGFWTLSLPEGRIWFRCCGMLLWFAVAGEHSCGVISQGVDFHTLRVVLV